MINLEVLKTLIPNPETGIETVTTLDFNKLNDDLSQGFRITNEAPGAIVGRVIVISRLNEDLFEVELNGKEFGPFQSDGETYTDYIISLERRKRIWKQPGSQTLERLRMEMGNRLPFSKDYVIAVGNGGGLSEVDFIGRYNASAVDEEQTAQYRAYLEIIHHKNLTPGKFSWASEK